MDENRTVEIEGRIVAEGVELLEVDTVCGIRVPIFRGTPAQIPALVEDDGSILDGFFCGITTAIYLRAGQPVSQERDSKNHERGHAFLQLSGLKNLLAGVVTWAKGYDDFEETLVRIAAPHLSLYQVQSINAPSNERSSCGE